MVQIGAALGSAIGQWARLTARNIRTLVACGAAGGVAATFNAPIAGAIFAMEVLVGRIQTDFLLVLLDFAKLQHHCEALFGRRPGGSRAGVLPHQPGGTPALLHHGHRGRFGSRFLRATALRQRGFLRQVELSRVLEASGGRACGGIDSAVPSPEVYGSGFPAIESALWTRYTWSLLLCLFVMEMLANCATLGSGGSGGVFAPGLYMGAMLGGAFGAVVHFVYPDWTATSGAYAMVGMAAFFAAAAKAPTTSILILFEMTGDYHIMLPLMAATVAACIFPTA